MCELITCLEKISKRMLRRGRGVPISPSINNVDIKSLVGEYNNAKTTYKINMSRNMSDFINGKISMDDYISLQQTEVTNAFTSAYTLGKRFGTGDLGASMDGLERRSLGVLIRDEMEYMKKFASDIQAGAGRMNYKRRLQMYVDSLNATFNYGRTVYIPEGVSIYWTLGITDKHCPDCIVNSANNPYKKSTLPGIPKSGHTQCLANCKCSLVYSTTSSAEEQDYVDMLTTIPQGSKKAIPGKEDYRHLITLRDEYYYNLYMYDITGDKKYLERLNDVKAQYTSYISKNDLAFPVYFYKREALRELKLFKKNAVFSLVDKITDLKPKNMVSVFLGNKQVYGVVQEINADEILIKTLEGLTYSVSPVRNVIYKEI